MEVAISLFKQYSGQGMIVALFLMSLVYLWFEEKEKEKRRLFVNFPIFLLVLFFCPVVVLVMEKFAEEDIYWRMLWSIPMLAIIAYVAVLLVRKQEGIKRYTAIAGILVLIGISGDYLYNNSGFLEAENLEHIPSEVVEVCDELIVEGREVRAAFPSECLMYVTQYTSLVHMPYGREMFLRSAGAIAWNELYGLIESEEIVVAELTEELRKQQCHYVVLRKDTELMGNMEDEDWTEYYQSESYIVFIDEQNNPHN